MKTQIRRSVFETNSSSTHSIAIKKDFDINSIPENKRKVQFNVGQFGWEFDTYDDIYSKASYLYTAIFCGGSKNPEEDWNKIVKILDDNRVVHVEEPYTVEHEKYEGVDYDVYKFPSNEFPYIDHAGETFDLIQALTSSSELLLSFLFDDSSVIATGNDNDDTDVINGHEGDSNYEEFYKGN